MNTITLDEDYYEEMKEENHKMTDQLTKAKEIIKKLYEDCYSIADVEDTNLGLWEEDLNQAQQFIKEIERC